MTRVAVITGGSTGIGKALGRRLVARGDDVVLAARTAADVEAAADELSALGPGKAWASVLDVQDERAVAETIRGVHRDHGRLDLLVNNAGINAAGLIEDLTPAHFDALYATNVRGVLNAVYAAYPLMIEQGYGQIANVASIGGLIPGPFEAPYTMSKFAVVGLTLVLRMEAARYGIKVSVMCPGLVETPFYDKGNPPGLARVRHEVTDVRALLRHGTHTRLISADRFAALAVRDLDRNRPVIVQPASIRWLWALYRLSPAVALAYGRHFADWGAARLGADWGAARLGSWSAPIRPFGPPASTWPTRSRRWAWTSRPDKLGACR